MPDVPSKPPSSAETDWTDWLKPRRWFVFAQRVFYMESTVEGLKSETQSLQAQNQETQRQIDRLQSQLELLMANMAATVDDKVRIAVLERFPELVAKELDKRDKGGKRK